MGFFSPVPVYVYASVNTIIMAASLFPSMLNPTSLFRILLSVLVLSFTLVQALEYIPEEADYNLNQNQTATQVLDYWGEWSDHDYHPSPTNWRFPFYSMSLITSRAEHPTDSITSSSFP